MTDTTTITVSTELRNESEIVLHAQFLAALLAGRANSGAGFVAPAPSSPWTPPASKTATRDAAYAAAASDPEYVAEQVAIAEARAVVADISPESVERQFRAYAAAKGAGAARKLLDKYNAPYLKDVPADRLSAFVAELV